MHDSAPRLRSAIHHVLRVGVVASGVLLVAGLSAVWTAGEAIPNSLPPNLGAAARGAFRFDGPSLIALGLLVLMSTPVVRVAVLAAGWLLEGDRRFAAVAATVLAILLASVALGVG